MKHNSNWERFKQYFYEQTTLGFSLDISRIGLSQEFLSSMSEPLRKAVAQMSELESGSVANPDENRMVGHYWLRNSQLAPSPEIKEQIDSTIIKVKEFAAKIHSGQLANSSGEKFRYALIIGIGGSALGPQFVNHALSSAQDPIRLFFFDNTDPDGMERVLHSIPSLAHCLAIIISKSGGTKETRNGMLIAEAAYAAKGLNFAAQACAITGEGSDLDKYAQQKAWISRLPMYDWIGGRTSELSAVGLLPAALQGIDVDSLLKGAADMDHLTRQQSFAENPAAQLALSWFYAVGGKGEKDMVILPYYDRLELISRYLQQLVMESLGKEKDLSGKVVNQGISVYGNKGSTDQHAYVQQLRDGVSNFFAIFIRVLNIRSSCGSSDLGFDPVSFEVEPGVVSGDYLSGFFQGTREALSQNHRESITITIDQVNAHSIGMLMALFERVVGLYANLIGINAYHQPGVEAGKKAATEVLKVQSAIMKFMSENKGKSFYLEQIAEAVGEEKIETIFLTLRHLSANGRIQSHSPGASLKAVYSWN